MCWHAAEVSPCGKKPGLILTICILCMCFINLNMDPPSLHRLFSACDVNKSGKIEYEDFTVVCRELNVSQTEIQTLFDKFGGDQDGYIDYSMFSSRFQEVSETLDLASFGAGSFQNQACPREEFAGRVDAESLLSER